MGAKVRAVHLSPRVGRSSVVRLWRKVLQGGYIETTLSMTPLGLGQMKVYIVGVAP